MMSRKNFYFKTLVFLGLSLTLGRESLAAPEIRICRQTMAEFGRITNKSHEGISKLSSQGSIVVIVSDSRQLPIAMVVTAAGLLNTSTRAGLLEAWEKERKKAACPRLIPSPTQCFLDLLVPGRRPSPLISLFGNRVSLDDISLARRQLEIHLRRLNANHTPQVLLGREGEPLFVLLPISTESPYSARDSRDDFALIERDGIRYYDTTPQIFFGGPADFFEGLGTHRLNDQTPAVLVNDGKTPQALGLNPAWFEANRGPAASLYQTLMGIPPSGRFTELLRGGVLQAREVMVYPKSAPNISLPLPNGPRMLRYRDLDPKRNRLLLVPFIDPAEVSAPQDVKQSGDASRSEGITSTFITFEELRKQRVSYLTSDYAGFLNALKTMGDRPLLTHEQPALKMTLTDGKVVLVYSHKALLALQMKAKGIPQAFHQRVFGAAGREHSAFSAFISDPNEMNGFMLITREAEQIQRSVLETEALLLQHLSSGRPLVHPLSPAPDTDSLIFIQIP